jgi:hypothetical protein
MRSKSDITEKKNRITIKDEIRSIKNDDGHTYAYGSATMTRAMRWEEGVRGVAWWLSMNRI